MYGILTLTGIRFEILHGILRGQASMRQSDKANAPWYRSTWAAKNLDFCPKRCKRPLPKYCIAYKEKHAVLWDFEFVARISSFLLILNNKSPFVAFLWISIPYGEHCLFLWPTIVSPAFTVRFANEFANGYQLKSPAHVELSVVS